jgi:hypothetical protein
VMLRTAPPHGSTMDLVLLRPLSLPKTQSI